MIAVVKVCERCGAKISSDITGEVCPACLLESGLGLFDGEPVAGIDGGSASPKTINAFGERVPPGAKALGPAQHGESVLRRTKILSDFGDYELLEEIGRGGQAVVYRAHQKSLNRIVALKVIGLGPWTTETHLKRFRREAEAAASLEHPGIVPIHEVGERDGQCYFSMKFVEGGQLDEMVRHSPISIRQAVELVAKVARTVHYAHEHGILHRDIKPGNILLDKNGEPHLTDFGLARLVEAESTVTATLDVLGTPSYMAPEQAAGETTMVSKATDVYGLGAVLYQLLTGQPPFAGGTTYETIKLLLETEPRQPRHLNPKIDRDLSTICLKCLEKDPQRRYSSALGLAEDLEHWLKHEPIRAKPSGFLTHGRKWVRRNSSTAVLVTLLITLAVGLGVTIWNRKPAVVIPKSVAVLPFENLNGNPDNAYFAEGIQEEILTRLAKIADLKVISRTSARHYQNKPRNLRDIAKQLGVANILEGSVQKSADQLRVNVQLINAQTDSHLWADTYDRKLTDIFAVESEIAKRIAESLQAKLTGREEQALAVKPTNNPEAYDAYLRGLAFEAGWESASPAVNLLTKAIGFYERAVQLDPNFAVAWARLSRADASVYHSHTTSAARRDAAKRALENAEKLEPDSPETLLALGYYQYLVLADYRAAESTFSRVSKMLSSNSDVRNGLGDIARFEGHLDQSIAYYEQGLALDPRNVKLVMKAAWTYAFIRQFPAALKLCDRALDITLNDQDVSAAKAAIYQAQGNLQEAAKYVSEITGPSYTEDTLRSKLTHLRLERNYGEAIRLLEDHLAQFHFASDYDKGWEQVALALMQRLAGDTDGAKVTAQHARNTFDQLYRDQQDNPVFATWLSQAYAVLGDKDMALKLAEHAVILWPSARDRMNAPGLEENLAFIQTIFGENSRAISTLTHLLQTPYYSWVSSLAPITPALLRLDPIWDALRSDPAFQKLCEEKIDRSIAVLPFENLSSDPNNGYFAEGIQEEILTRLAKIADLKVISRTSTSRYKSKPDDIAEIAKQLGVANILEGSVQKTADQVRVNVQLINAQSDSHLWADSYDRKLTDILGVESDVAKRIAESLQAKLSGQEKRALAVKPTNNPEAYDAYLRGLVFDARGDSDPPIVDLLTKATGFYERAVQLDPNFALAWARLSRADAFLYHSGEVTDAGARRETAKRALENAQKLEPNSPETLVALGYYQYRGLRDFEAAKITLGRVGRMLPSNSDVPHALGSVVRRQGHWDESIAYFEQALGLDPRNTELLSTAACTYGMLRQFPTALKLYDRMLDITPSDPDVMASEASIYQAQGNLPEAARLLSGINEQTSPEVIFVIKINQLRLERNYAEAVRLLQARLAQFHSASQFSKGFDQVALALMQRLGGDTAGAKTSAEQARSALEPVFRNQPDSVGLAANFALLLSQAYAELGEKDSALQVANRAIVLLPRDKDAVSGPSFEENLAFIQTTVGETSSAISTLTRLLQTPYNSLYSPGLITPALLRLDPIWDPLRSDPTFQNLCKEKQPPATP